MYNPLIQYLYSLDNEPQYLFTSLSHSMFPLQGTSAKFDPCLGNSLEQAGFMLSCKVNDNE